jgi:hypothetical protein
MLGLGWLTLRQAQEALRSGRLEDAQHLLQQPDLAGHKGSFELLQQVAHGFVERAERHLRHGDLPAAWHDLHLAEDASPADAGAARLRQALVQRVVQDARAFLDAGEPARAAEALARMGGAVHQPECQLLQDLAKGWVSAQELAGRGEFAHAAQLVERVRRLQAPPPLALVKFHQELSDRGRKCSDLLVKLHEAVDRRQWRDALLLAEQVLALAPHQPEARKVRAQAWKSVEPATAAAVIQPIEPPVSSGNGKPAEAPGERYMLWIDGVGGYLVCLGNRVTIGQATPEARVDVPLFADVSRLHAALTRDAEGYLLEGVRSVRVNGRPTDRALLESGARFTLGSCCMLLFSQPVPVSATAQLELVSGHRLPLHVDKVFLMADTLVLGPGPQAHVVIPDLNQPVVLFRQKEGLGVRYGGDFVVDGDAHRDRATLGVSSRVSGEGFAFAVERLGADMGK